MKLTLMNLPKRKSTEMKSNVTKSTIMKGSLLKSTVINPIIIDSPTGTMNSIAIKFTVKKFPAINSNVMGLPKWDSMY